MDIIWIPFAVCPTNVEQMISTQFISCTALRRWTGLAAPGSVHLCKSRSIFFCSLGLRCTRRWQLTEAGRPVPTARSPVPNSWQAGLDAAKQRFQSGAAWSHQAPLSHVTAGGSGRSGLPSTCPGDDTLRPDRCGVHRRPPLGGPVL